MTPSLPPPDATPRRARIRPGRVARLSRRLGRPPSQGVRALRAHHRHRPSRTRLPGGCSGLSTTARVTAVKPPAIGSPSAGPTPGSCNCPCTPPGSTRSRSTSPSCSARCSLPTTSPTSPTSRRAWPPSSAATNRPRHPSNGSSPATTSLSSSRNWPTNPTTRPPREPTRIRDRNYGPEHLGAVGAVGLVVVGYAIGPVILARSLGDLPGLGVVAASLALCALAYAPIAV